MISHIIRAIKNKKFTYKNIKNYLNFRVVSTIDRYYDKRITGLDLTVTVPSIYQDFIKQTGMTASQPTHYCILEKVFSHVSISESDIFIDVGCGKGRILSFLLREKCPCKIFGVELSEVPGRIALQWTEKYDQVNVNLGDAFEVDYSEYTIICLSRPFLTKTFFQFVELLEQKAKQKIIFIYIFDQVNVFYLKNRPGWKMKYREKFFKIHGLQMASCPQWFSIWEYEPSK